MIGPVHAMGARLDNRWHVAAGCLSSDPQVARESGADWFLPPDRIYTDFRQMAAREAARPDGIDAVITTTNKTHHEIAKAFLADIICDKPLTMRRRLNQKLRAAHGSTAPCPCDVGASVAVIKSR